MRIVEALPIHLAKSRTQRPHLVTAEASTLQADDVQAASASRIAVGGAVWRDILGDFGTTADDATGANATELVDGAQPAEDDMIFHGDMSGKGPIVGEDHMISDDAIVGNVDVAQEMVVAADEGLLIGCSGAVNGAEFPKSVVITHLKPSRLPLVLQILGLLSDGAISIKLVTFANEGGAQ